MPVIVRGTPGNDSLCLRISPDHTTLDIFAGLVEFSGGAPLAGNATAAAMDAYILADRGTWLNFKNRGELGIIVEGDQRLFNQYGVILVNPAKHPHVKQADGQKFIDWVVSNAGQKAIADYKIGGEQLFFPNARN